MELTKSEIEERSALAKKYGFKPLDGQYPLVHPFSGGYEVRYDSDKYKIYPRRKLFNIVLENFINLNHAAFAWNSIVKIFESNSFPKYNYECGADNACKSYDIDV
jgi:hypothetical protein